MFMTSDNNNGHADGPSVEDEFVRETSRTMGQIMAVARAWIKAQRGRRGTARAPKLSRKQRRELAEAIQQEVGERRIAEAWATKRVTDYHAEVVAEQHRRQSPGYTPDQAAADHQRLARIRYTIESATHASPLTIEQRGQVSLALSRVQAHPSRPLGAVFTPMTAEQERAARAAAVRSETWVHERREANERVLTAARNREQARLNARPPLAWAEMTTDQQFAVQRLRGAELELRKSGGGHTTRTLELDRELRAAAREVRATGLPLRQVAYECDNIVDNAKFEVAVYGSPQDGGRWSWHATEGEALAHAETALESMSEWDRGYSVQVGPRYGVDPTGNARSVYGDREFVGTVVAGWQGDHETGWQAKRSGPLTEISVRGIDPATGRDVRVENVVMRVDELGALEHAQRTVHLGEWGAERVDVRITDAAADYDHDFTGDPTLFGYEGSPAVVETQLVGQQAVWHARLAKEAQAASARAVADRDSVQQRLNLSIEHNGDLTEQNAELTRRLTAMTAERDQAVTERRDSDMKRVQALAEQGRLRGERDEAVAKLAETTRPSDRFGSAERQATQASATAAAAPRPTHGRSGSSRSAASEEAARGVENLAERPEVDPHEQARTDFRQLLVDEAKEAYADTDSEMIRQARAKFEAGVETCEDLAAAQENFFSWWGAEGRTEYRADRAASQRAGRATSTKSATATASTESESESPTTESVPWETEPGGPEQPSARTVYSGNALADAMNRQAEREGMER